MTTILSDWTRSVGLLALPILAWAILAPGGLFWTAVLAMGVIGAAVATAASGHTVPAYWSGLVLLGLGWNLLFIGAPVLLTQTLAPAERFRAHLGRQPGSNLCQIDLTHGCFPRSQG